MINFCYDRLAMPDIGYPNLAQWTAEPYTPEWRQFDAHWPRTVPLRLIMYLDAAHIPYGVSTVATAPKGSWYPVALSWFDFDCNYFTMLSTDVKARLIKKEIKILFYYHEGDNPQRIDDYLNQCRYAEMLPSDCYHIVSANTAADQLESATYFSDHEHFFRVVNQKQEPGHSIIDRNYIFTMLNRTHKWWRAGCTVDLLQRNVLENSLWSYGTDCVIKDNPGNNPIKLFQQTEWQSNIKEFIKNGPYLCDDFDSNGQNNHHYVNQDLYTKSYFQIITETHFDADQSQGVFITEKTYKPIKYGQPFIIIGPAGTLAELRRAGYRTFDSVLDNTYDTIEHNLRRWFAIRDLLTTIKNSDPHELFMRCQDDIEWNKKIFNHQYTLGLNTLIEKLQCQI